MTPSIESNETRRDAKVHERTSPMRNHTRIMEPICCKLLFHKEEGRKITPHPGLPTHQQMDEEK
jgi:hypothetical protein